LRGSAGPPVRGSGGNPRDLESIGRAGPGSPHIQTTGFASCSPSRRWKRYYPPGIQKPSPAPGRRRSTHDAESTNRVQINSQTLHETPAGAQPQCPGGCPAPVSGRSSHRPSHPVKTAFEQIVPTRRERWLGAARVKASVTFHFGRLRRVRLCGFRRSETQQFRVRYVDAHSGVSVPATELSLRH
jgi:hypothetical protein